MKKRLFSWLLVLAMVLSMMPTVAFATGEEAVDSDSTVIESDDFESYTVDKPLPYGGEDDAWANQPRYGDSGTITYNIVNEEGRGKVLELKGANGTGTQQVSFVYGKTFKGNYTVRVDVKATEGADGVGYVGEILLTNSAAKAGTELVEFDFSTKAEGFLFNNSTANSVYQTGSTTDKVVFALDTWYTVELVVNGNAVTGNVYDKDGVLLGSKEWTGAAMDEAYLHLEHYNYKGSSYAASYFDNLSVTCHHQWDSGVTTTEPTTEAEGVRTYTCDFCGTEKTETIDKLEHVCADHVFTAAKAPTCIATGNIAYWSCGLEGCENVYADVDGSVGSMITAADIEIAIDPDAHNMTIDVLAQDPDGETAGYTAHTVCEYCSHTEGKNNTWLITAGDENVTLSTSGVVEEGTMIAASPVQAGYAIKALKVNGEAVNGSAFVVDKAATVTAELVEWKRTENFDYEAGTGLPATMAGNGYTEGTVSVVKKGEMTLVTTTDADKDRIGMVTAEKYSGSYVIETRINSNTVSGGYTMLYLNGVKFPRINNSAYSSIRYDMRLRESVTQPWIELNKPVGAGVNTGNASLVSEMGNKITGGADGTGTRMYFYAHGNPNNKVTDAAAVTYKNGEWYTVKFYVDSVNKSVTTELWNSDGTTLLGSRTLYDAIINSGNFEIQSQLGGTTTVDYIKYACTHGTTTDVAPVAPTCGEDGTTAGKQCTDCGAIVSGVEKDPATGDHDYAEDITKQPTTTEEGEATYTCTVCGDSYTKVLDPVDCEHPVLTHHEPVDPTCSAAGNIEYWSCDAEGCGLIFADEAGETMTTLDAVTLAIDPTAHNPVQKDALAPNEETAGHTAYTECEYCGDIVGKKTTYLLNVAEGLTVNVADTTAVLEGTVVSVSTTKSGYTVGKVSVNGTAIAGTTFTMDTNNTTVTADLVAWKAFEGFDGDYGETFDITKTGITVDVSTNANYNSGHVYAVTNKDGVTALNITAEKDCDNTLYLGDPMAKMKGSYVFEMRMKYNCGKDGTPYTHLYTTGIKSFGPGSTNKTKGAYAMRLAPFACELWRNNDGGGATNDNAIKNAYVAQNQDWATVRVTVNDLAGTADDTVLTEIFGADNTLLGTYTLTSANSLELAATVSMGIKARTAVTDIDVDYFAAACLHANVENVEAVANNCGKDGHTEGTRCKDCGATLSGIETIPATGEHDMQLVDAKDPSVGNIGWNEHTACSVCGLKDESYEEIPAYVIDTKGYSLKLEEDVYIYVATKIANFGDEVNGGMLVWNEEPADVTVEADYVSELTLDGDVYIQNTKGVPAKAYADKVYFCTYVEKDGTKYYGKLNSYSVQDYCAYQLAKSDDAALKTVCSEMLHYGAAAQNNFGYNTGALANAIEGIETAGTWDASKLTAPTPAGDPVGFTAGGAAGTWYAALDLSSLVTMNFAFATEATDENVELLVWYADEDLSLDNADRYDMTTATVAGANAYTAAIKGTAAKEYGDTVYACVKVGDTYSTILAYSVEAYAAKTIADEMAEADLCKRMVMYGEAAAEYFAPAAE